MFLWRPCEATIQEQGDGPSWCPECHLSHPRLTWPAGDLHTLHWPRWVHHWMGRASSLRGQDWRISGEIQCWINTFRLKVNGQHFGNILKCIFFNENNWFFIQFSPKTIPRGPIEHKSTLVQVMDCHWTGDKPLPEPMLTQIYDAIWHHWATMS